MEPNLIKGARRGIGAAAEASRRVLAGEVGPGFQTPIGLFCNGFAETIAKTTIQIIQD